MGETWAKTRWFSINEQTSTSTQLNHTLVFQRKKSFLDTTRVP